MKPRIYYQDEHSVIWHGDCRDVLPLLEPVDLVLADPPYGIGECSRRNNSRGKPFGSRRDSKNTRGTFVAPINYGEYSWDETPTSDEAIYQTIQAGAHAIIWGGNYFGLPRQSKWLVWDKINSGDFADCELAWTNLPGAVRIFRHMWNGMLRASERGGQRVHPTQKPVALMGWCIQQKPGVCSLVDPYMGSGPSLVAAKQLGIHATGIEISEKYCEIAVDRLRQEVLPFSSHPPVKLPQMQDLFEKVA